MRENIKADTFPAFIKSYMKERYPDDKIPQWIVDAMGAVNVRLESN